MLPAPGLLYGAAGAVLYAMPRTPNPTPADLPAMLAALFAAADAAGLSGVEVARTCGVHPTTASRWRSGTQAASVADVQPLADRLGMTLTPHPLRSPPWGAHRAH